MDNVIGTFRWQFKEDVAVSMFCEGDLLAIGSSASPQYGLRVSLVRDEMRQPGEGELADQEQRTVHHVYVGFVGEALDERVRTLAYCAPIHGTRLIYPVLFDACLTNPHAVERFGDKWLIHAMTEAARRKGVRPPRLQAKPKPKAKATAEGSAVTGPRTTIKLNLAEGSLPVLIEGRRCQRVQLLPQDDGSYRLRAEGARLEERKTGAKRKPKPKPAALLPAGSVD